MININKNNDLFINIFSKINISKRKMLSLLLHFVVILVFIFLNNIVLFSNEYYKMKFLEIILMILYVYTIFSAKMHSGWFESYMIFLYTLFLFNFSRILLDLVNYKEFGWATKFADFYFTYDVRNEIILIFIYILLFIHFGFLLSQFFNSITINTQKSQKVQNIDKFQLKQDKFITKIGIILTLLATPMLLVKMIIQMKVIYQYGYESYYSGILKNIEYPFYTNGSGTILTIGFILFLMSVPTKKEFYSISSIYLVIKFVDSLKGARAIFLTQLLFLMWYYFKVYSVNVKFKTIIKTFLFVILFSQILVTVRSKEIFNYDLIDGLASFLFSQGVSYLVVGYIINYKDIFVGEGIYPYIFQGLFGFKAQSMETLKNGNSLADKMTYYLNQNAYLSGEGIGSNFIAEFYDLGIFWLVLLCVILGILIVQYEKIINKNRFYLMTSIYFIPNLFYIPRGSFFGGGLIKNILFILLLYISVYLLKQVYFWIHYSYYKKIKI